ncbi:hypothetical protein [Allorhizobium terrae]|uniref:Uncharacterized protein n=1 Tax=Allorhizobium terrae TaxID=1848972 RepID=A0A4S4A5Z9_9HYPH|nr:hypothetical protein [Allorhizobium terrae]THF53968.1 hypothetical protein E6C51_02360 [Allorhizobium terrae]
MTNAGYIRLGTVAVSLCLALSGSAYAKSTGWLNANRLQDFGREHLHANALPTSISCKDSDVVAGMDRRNTMVKIEYSSNPEHIKWKWAWGGLVGKIDRDYAAKGYKMVSQDSFRRPSGLLMRCAIWQKRN